MRFFRFEPEGEFGGSVTAWLHTSCCEERTLPTVIICPGGGYAMVSPREGEPVAQEYFAAGYQVFILHYATGEELKPFEPLCQLAATIAHVRKYAKEWQIKKDCIAVAGFSAGGHLAASLGTLINTDEFAHVPSIETVSGAPQGSDAYGWFGLDHHVDASTPPTFLWHTATDDVVPVENSLKFATALSKNKIPMELHIFPTGGHGMSVCTCEVNTQDDYNGRWVELSIQWLKKMFEFQK
jgi:acetyl esterase/lipase